MEYASPTGTPLIVFGDELPLRAVLVIVEVVEVPELKPKTTQMTIMLKKCCIAFFWKSDAFTVSLNKITNDNTIIIGYRTMMLLANDCMTPSPAAAPAVIAAIGFVI